MDLLATLADDSSMERLLNVKLNGNLCFEVFNSLGNLGDGCLDAVTRSFDRNNGVDFFGFLNTRKIISEISCRTSRFRGKEICTPPQSSEILLISSARRAVKFLWYFSGTSTVCSSILSSSLILFSRISFALATPSFVPRIVI